MGLFGTKKANQTSVSQVVEMVKEYFHRRGEDLGQHEIVGCEGYGWWITEGSAKIYIFIQEDRVGPLLRVNSPVLHLPKTNREAFFLRLLEINRDLTSCGLAVYEDVVIVSGQRHIQGLDQEELNALIWNVSYVADTLDDQLAGEFQAEIYKEQ